MLVTMIPAFAVSAATDKINIQAVDVYVDVPVNGLPLNKLEGDELATGEVDGKGGVDIYDALRLFKFVNEEIDEL